MHVIIILPRIQKKSPTVADNLQQECLEVREHRAERGNALLAAQQRRGEDRAARLDEPQNDTSFR